MYICDTVDIRDRTVSEPLFEEKGLKLWLLLVVGCGLLAFTPLRYPELQNTYPNGRPANVVAAGLLGNAVTNVRIDCAKVLGRWLTPPRRASCEVVPPEKGDV